jgi:PAS domain S-box-containing protein
MGGEVDKYRIEKRYIRKDGTVVWVELSVSAIKDKNGEIVKLIRLTTDITERKKAEENLRITEEQLQIRQKMDSL